MKVIWGEMSNCYGLGKARKRQILWLRQQLSVGPISGKEPEERSQTGYKLTDMMVTPVV